MLTSISQLLLQSQQGSLAYAHPDKEALEALATGDYQKAESFLLSHCSDSSPYEELTDRIWLLCQLYNQQVIPRPYGGLVRRIANVVEQKDLRMQHLILQMARLRRSSGTGPAKISLDALSGGFFPHLDLEICSALVRHGRLDEAQYALNQSNAELSCEGAMLHAQLITAQGQPEAAETLLLGNWEHYKHRLDYCMQLVELLFQLRRGDLCIPVLKQAVRQHGLKGSPLLERFAQARMQQRQPGLALRLKLKERMQKFSGVLVSQPTVLGSIYDGLGRTDWLSYLAGYVEQSPAAYPELHTNRLMHLSSRVAANYPSTCRTIVRLITESISPWLNPYKKGLPINQCQHLRIGWICADIANHPVARFLLSWLSATAGKLQHEHLVIKIAPGDARYETLFKQLPQVSFIDQSAPGLLTERINRLRELDLDIAVDLNGWTGNNLAPAFVARIAPLQLNYLAYHASTGIPAMDIWVVDQHILPTGSACEWHTEKLLRLTRPFLAWQPHPSLPEARAVVSEIAFEPSSGIRFGCFNHVRKISDETLRCWARILTALPTSKLVLKAHNLGDNATAILLQRRLERTNLPLQQVIWLPYTATPDEHLQQYTHMDVALDSFPNTGCTTTCEALWMGVPVISLEGAHYVSRMAAAVLHGAGLPEWISTSIEGYEQLALQQAQPDRLSWLRQNRHHWRKQLQQSPLGDAQDLMNHLESNFTLLAERCIQKQAF